MLTATTALHCTSGTPACAQPTAPGEPKLPGVCTVQITLSPFRAFHLSSSPIHHAPSMQCRRLPGTHVAHVQTLVITVRTSTL